MSVLVEYVYLYPRGLRDSGSCLVRVRSCSLMGHTYDAGGDTIPGGTTCSCASVSVLVGYICLSPRGGSGFLATILAEAPCPDGLRVPDLRCRASWSPSASPLMVSVCLSPHGVYLPLLSWCTSASPLREYVCLSHHGVHLPLPSWSEWLRELYGTSVRLACGSNLDVLLPSPFSAWGASTASVWGKWMACWVSS